MTELLGRPSKSAIRKRRKPVTLPAQAHKYAAHSVAVNCCKPWRTPAVKLRSERGNFLVHPIGERPDQANLGCLDGAPVAVGQQDGRN